jgi:hypothetical protein
VCVFVIRRYVNMLTNTVTYSCMATVIFVVLQFSKYEAPEYTYDVNAKS